MSTSNRNQRTMNDIFSLLLGGGGADIMFTGGASHFTNTLPMPCDVINTADRITIYAEMPGLSDEDIEINCYNNEVKISAEKKCDNNLTTGEIRYGKYERTIQIPICITRRESIVPKYENGILKIMINRNVEEVNRFTLRLNNNESNRRNSPISSNSTSST